ncbi:hypothetical protein [Rhodococcus wratislaviensis]|uniref:hypothetical protein n=1 Tax=Rhodococcus wratislaviensis TaxID=44752 RepID=UPI000F588AF6|nr:hypothetical protein [Rhodococcus wratislaviensis]
MVVTRSRLHAIRMTQAFDDGITSKSYRGISTLVAFSESVEDPDVTEKEYTEAEKNGFSEGQLPKQFGSDDYQVLVIAETYQTGFDEPLLHIMYVDEKVKTKGVRVSRPCLVSTGSRPARPTPSCSTL